MLVHPVMAMADIVNAHTSRIRQTVEMARIKADIVRYLSRKADHQPKCSAKPADRVTFGADANRTSA